VFLEPRIYLGRVSTASGLPAAARAESKLLFPSSVCGFLAHGAKRKDFNRDSRNGPPWQPNAGLSVGFAHENETLVAVSRGSRDAARTPSGSCNLPVRDGTGVRIRAAFRFVTSRRPVSTGEGGGGAGGDGWLALDVPTLADFAPSRGSALVRAIARRP